MDFSTLCKEVSRNVKKRSPENSSKALILWVLLRPISSILCPCPLPKFRAWEEEGSGSSGLKGRACLLAAVGSWEIRGVFWVRTPCWRMRVEWRFGNEFLIKGQKLSFLRVHQSWLLLTTSPTSEHQQHRKNTATTHPSKLDVTLMRDSPYRLTNYIRTISFTFYNRCIIQDNPD